MASLNDISKKDRGEHNTIYSKTECLVYKPRGHVGVEEYLLSFLASLVGIAWSTSGSDSLIHLDKGAR